MLIVNCRGFQLIWTYLAYMQHATLGQLLLGTTVFTFAYITCWLLVTVSRAHSGMQKPYSNPMSPIHDAPCCLPVLLQPFIDAGQPVLRLFPATSFLYLPLGLCITSFIAAVLGFVGWLLFTEPAAQPACASSST